MPAAEQPSRHPHLRLVVENRSGDRRTHPAPPTPPPLRARETFAPAVSQSVARALATVSAPQGVAGFNPNLVLRIPLAKGTPVDTFADRLREVNIVTVSIEPSRAIVAFREGTDLTEFQAAMAAYAAGPRTGINRSTGEPYKSTKWDVFEYMDPLGLRTWSREDRVGTRLSAVIGPDGRHPSDAVQVLDVEMWHRGTRDLAAASLQTLREIVSREDRPQNRVHDSFVGDQLCLARVSVDRATLNELLELDLVSELELPPTPVFHAEEIRTLTPKNFASVVAPPADGPALCMVDSGVNTGHPFLAKHVAHASAVLRNSTSAADQNGHGTMVAGLAVFGSIRACYGSGVFASTVRLYSARILNDQNRFEDESLIVRQTEEAILRYYNAPYNCRVFNLSIGSAEPAFRPDGERQTVWAERLDYLCRTLKILIVVSAGNYSSVFTTRSEEAERFKATYPAYLLDHEARLNDPATAAIPVTVGSIAEHDVHAVRQGLGANDIVSPLAAVDHPSPFTRVGLGLAGAIKPEFVEYGGNAVFTGTMSSRRVVHEPGTAVMSLSNKPLERLFSFNAGTSFAAPLVARRAALTWSALAALLETQPDPNLVRAVLGVSARVPSSMKAAVTDESSLFRFAGYGQIDEARAFNSFNNDVTMVAEGKQKLDTFSVYAVPIPDVMLQAAGVKTIRVALAYDPPVRRRRMDYLGVDMAFQMIRGKTLDEVIAAYRALDPSVETEPTIAGSAVIAFLPKSRPRKVAHKRAASTLQVGEFKFRQDASHYGNLYWLVVRSQRRWAPSPEFETQDYGIAVSLSANTDELYANVSLQLRQRTRIRTRG